MLPKRIGTDVDVGPLPIFMGQPTEIMRLKNTLERNDSLPRLTRSLVPDQQRNRLTGRKRTSEELGGDADRVFEFRRPHMLPPGLK
jgi:hypothetical protein